jgi:hypothetical protein
LIYIDNLRSEEDVDDEIMRRLSCKVWIKELIINYFFFFFFRKLKCLEKEVSESFIFENFIFYIFQRVYLVEFTQAKYMKCIKINRRRIMIIMNIK